MSGFEKINWDATYEATKGLLKGYQNKQMAAARYSIMMKSPVITDMPGVASVSNHVENKLTDGMEEAQEAKYECAMIENTIRGMRDIDNRHEIMAELLALRYLKGMKAKDVRKLLTAQSTYTLDLPERTYNDYLHDAIYSFAMMYPKDEIRILVK